jgi:uncharacterized protein
MARTTQLFELQQVDSQSDELLRRALSIRHALDETDSLRAARERHAAALAVLAGAQERLRVLSHEVDEMSAHLTLQSKRLYDGSVKNSKELVAIEHDVTTTKDLRSAREDVMLEAMDAVDQAQAAVDAAARDLEVAETEWQRNQDGLLEEKDTLDGQLRVLRARREKMVAGIAWADLQLYEKLRKAKHGIAIAGLEHDICQACRVTVPGGTLRTVKQGQEFVYCPSCARVLHPGARGELVRW